MAPSLDSLIFFLQSLTSQVFSRLAQILELLRQNQVSLVLLHVPSCRLHLALHLLDARPAIEPRSSAFSCAFSLKWQASAGLAAVAAFAISVLFAWRMARMYPSTGGARRKRQEGEQPQPQRGATSSAISSSAFPSHDPSSSASSSSTFGPASAGLAAAASGKGLHVDSAAVCLHQLLMSINSQRAQA